MSDDLVKRLRDFWTKRFALIGTGTRWEFESDVLHTEAADRIEQLEAALREIEDCCTLPAGNDFEMRQIARKALEGKDD